ncbi:MAG: beta-ketoacyl synthase [Pseudomonadales bacterium]|nr:beta-ketoacyl synthase [Pseudomonadales bacterium]
MKTKDIETNVDTTSECINMAPLPVIIGFGGINSAGRSSFHHGYRRLVIDALSEQNQRPTYQDLATLMGLTPFNRHDQAMILNNTLIRKIESNLFNEHQTSFNYKMNLQPEDGTFKFTLKKRELPDTLPPSWHITAIHDDEIGIEAKQSLPILLPHKRINKVQSAGQLPTGFDPGSLYCSHHQPRGLQMTIYGASDAIQSTGIPWETIKGAVRPDQIAVYANSAMGQLDDSGSGGMMNAASNGVRPTPKQCALGFSSMPADFINAYVLNSVGSTGGSTGACATFLYNLRQGVRDIQSGKCRVVLVGTSEAPVIPEVMEAYRTMGALAEDKGLLELDQHLGLTETDYRRACRPFGDNCGFTIAESAQFVLLCDDELAIELGAQIFGAVPDVFVQADGNKKSIASPGIGNYITMAKAARLVVDMLGRESLQQRSYIHAHGTGTPQNRVTESHVMNEIAKAFGINDWPVSAIKCYLGHSIGSAAGDQLAATLGTWKYGIIPGIKTIDKVADDVQHSHLNLSTKHIEIPKDAMDTTLINAKGFGGNNSTALIMAPHIVKSWLAKKYSKAKLNNYEIRCEHTVEIAEEYNQAAMQGSAKVMYHFGKNVLNGNDLTITDNSISIPGFKQNINLTSPFAEIYAVKN